MAMERFKIGIICKFHHNDSKQNIRDLMLDSDHSRAVNCRNSKNILKLIKINFV